MRYRQGKLVSGRPAIALFLIISAVPVSGLAATPQLTPAPKEIVWTSERLPLSTTPTIVAAAPAEQQVARVLAAEMERLYKVRPKVAGMAEGARIELALAGSLAGKARLTEWAGWATWPVPRNSEEGYLLQVDGKTATVIAAAPRGLLYGCQTLLQLVRCGKADRGPSVPGVRIRDWPQLAFRGVHLCIFPNTELPAIRQAILLAARYKYNAVVIEPWASLKSRLHPETAYEHAYTSDEVRPLVRLGQALQMDMVPMLNSWGHASGMRASSAEHAVLDRFPEFRPLYESDGWSFRLSNPAARRHLFERYGELLELFAPARYFHAGMDEAWGHLGPAKGVAQGEEARKLLAGHLHEIHDYFAGRKVQVLMWHDMFIQRDDPNLGRGGPANSIPPFSTHLVLDELPKDVIIAAWNYGVTGPWPVPRYFRDKGFRVVVSPWKTRRNTVALLNTAKDLDLMGVLATTWDSLDVALPSVAQAGVLAWEPPGSDLGRIPFDHWVTEIRKLPIVRLPALETTLQMKSE